MATLVLGVGVEICLSKANLCCFCFFTIILLIWCENEFLSQVFFLPHCSFFRPHPYLSIMAMCWSQSCVDGAVWTCYATLQCSRWPAVKQMDSQHCRIFRALKAQALTSLKTCWGNFGLYLKKQTRAHTHALAHVLFFLKGQLCASLSFPSTHSPPLTLSVAETTCILFNWILWGRAFCVFPRHFGVVGVIVYMFLYIETH